MINVCTLWMAEASENTVLKQVKLCNFDEETVSIFQREADERFGSEPCVRVELGAKK
jgi:hypothetical protein